MLTGLPFFFTVDKGEGGVVCVVVPTAELRLQDKEPYIARKVIIVGLVRCKSHHKRNAKVSWLFEWCWKRGVSGK
jgi:hypothetical protein